MSGRSQMHSCPQSALMTAATVIPFPPHHLCCEASIRTTLANLAFPFENSRQAAALQQTTSIPIPPRLLFFPTHHKTGNTTQNPEYRRICIITMPARIDNC
ncbi:unnamed protein product [Periconia digitata]|uniref:Uncharacterized protein n=1 Tax=Periconia digitata TaxID=1303443 RepID=A0A9W4UGM0_9PLEO|nr:unnamed protein product [Periconia digitata]